MTYLILYLETHTFPGEPKNSRTEVRLRRKKVTISDDLSGAENETRTRDPNLGKVVLYQLSYFRKIFKFSLKELPS